MSTDPTPQTTPITEEEWPDTSQWPVILQQDDCAPDSDWHFMQDFPLKAGMEFEDFKKAARCRIVKMGTEWLLNDMEVSHYADDPFYTLRRKPQDPTPQATPPAVNTGITVAGDFMTPRFTTGSYAWTAWGPIPTPQTQPPEPVGEDQAVEAPVVGIRTALAAEPVVAESAGDDYDREGEIAAVILDHSYVDPERNLSRVLRECDFGATARAILARWGRPTALAEPFPSHGEVCQWLERQGHWGDNAHRIPRIANMVQDALARWGRPAARAALKAEPAEDGSRVGEVGEFIQCLQIRAASLGAEGANLSQRGDAAYFTRAATLLQQLYAPAPVAVPVVGVEVLEVSSPEPAPAAAQPPLWRDMVRAYLDAPERLDGNDHQGYAAEILAVRDRVVPEEHKPPAGDGEPWPQAYQQRSDAMWEQRQAIRSLLTAEAARAEAGE